MKLFELYNKRPRREDRTALAASIRLCEGMVKIFDAEWDNGIDFEPQPDYANVKGVNIDDTGQNISYQQNTRKSENQKLNKAWVMLLSKMENLDKEQRRKLRPHLQKVANAAAKRNFTLTPSAEQVFGL